VTQTEVLAALEKSDGSWEEKLQAAKDLLARLADFRQA